ncbi:hypothetical protein Dimus_039227 [Dionaea muscipula]
MQLFGVEEVIMCRAFPSIFKGATRQWFVFLPPRSVSRFSQLRDAFTGQFASSCIFSRVAPSLFSDQQRPDESLIAFMTRFNMAYIQIPSLGNDIALIAIQIGLRSNAFLDDLTLRRPADFGQLLQRTRTYMTLKDHNSAQAAFDPKVERHRESKRDASSERDHRRDRSSRRSETRPHRIEHPRKEHTPPMAPGEQVSIRSADRWCTFHKHPIHDTTDCRVLKSRIDSQARTSRPSSSKRSASSRSTSPGR